MTVVFQALLVAALAYRGQGWKDLHDAVFEIGGASLPLLFIPLRGSRTVGEGSPAPMTRSPIAIGAAVVIYALFVATQGRGVAF